MSPTRTPTQPGWIYRDSSRFLSHGVFAVGEVASLRAGEGSSSTNSWWYGRPARTYPLYFLSVERVSNPSILPLPSASSRMGEVASLRAGEDFLSRGVFAVGGVGQPSSADPRENGDDPRGSTDGPTPPPKQPGYTIVFGHDPADAERVKREVSEVIHDEDAKAAPFTWAIVIFGDQAEAMVNLLHGDDDVGRDEAKSAIIGAALPIRWWSPARWTMETNR